MSDITFSMLLTQIMDASNVRFAREAYRIVSDAGVDVSYSTFANYKSFTTVPPFNTARRILDCFDYACSDEELRDILDYSSRELKFLRDDSKKLLRRGISMNPDYFKPGLNPDTLQNMIEDAAREDLGDDATINEYISFLIRNDLTQKGYI